MILARLITLLAADPAAIAEANTADAIEQVHRIDQARLLGLGYAYEQAAQCIWCRRCRRR